MSLRTAARALARTPTFTIVAIVTLAIGIGATTAMLSIVNGVLFKPLRFPDADRLYAVETLVAAADLGAAELSHFPVNARHFSEWRAHCAACEGVALLGAQGYTLTGSGTPERLPALEVSANFFKTLGVAPQIGRDFATDEEGPGRTNVVLLSDVAWRTRFGADPSIVGRSILLNGQPTIVVGVMPATLVLPRGTQWGPFFGHNRVPLLFRPVAVDFASARPWTQFNYAAVVRTKPGVSPREAERQMTAAVAEIAREHGGTLSASLIPMGQQMTGAARQGLLLLAGAVAAVLALVSLNVGGLLLVRSVGRAREASIKLALGAAPMDLIRPMLAEVLVLIVAGAAFGVLFARSAVTMLVAAAPVDLPRIDELQPDWSMLLPSLTATLFAALMASLAPIWRLTRVELRQPLTSATRAATETRSPLRALDTMVVVEVAISTAVLILGSLLATSFLNVMRADRGFETMNVITQPVPLTSTKYQGALSRSQMMARALDSFRAIPGVLMVGVTSQLPLRGETWVDVLADADRPADGGPAQLANHRFISPQFIGAMGIHVIEGRDIEETDRARPVALLSEKAAARLWPGQSPIGKRIIRTTLPPEAPSEAAEIVGLVADVRSAGLEQEPAAVVYEPYWQIGPGGPVFVFRTERDPGSLAADIRAAVATLDPDLPLAPPQPMATIVSESAGVRRFQTTLVASFAIASLAIAALGLYGLMSFSVTRRTRELGLRIALGATSGRILALVIRQGLRPVALGGAIGLAAALVAGDWLAAQLYGVGAQDGRVLTIVALTLGVVAIAACCVPAWRATRVDPMIPLRAE